MADFNKDQWGNNPQNNSGYQPVYHPGPSPVYAESAPSQSGYGGDQKSPYEGDRFKPKTRINDPFFLIFFILQVSPMSFCMRGLVLGSKERWWGWECAWNVKLTHYGQFAAFAVLSAIAISEWVKEGGLGGGIGGGDTGNRITLN